MRVGFSLEPTYLQKVADFPVFCFDTVDDIPEFQAAIARIPALALDDLPPRTKALTVYHGYVKLVLGTIDGPAMTRLLWDIANWIGEVGNVVEDEWQEDILPAFRRMTGPERTLAAAVGGAAVYVFTGNWSSHGSEVSIERDGWPFTAGDAIGFETVLVLAEAAGVPARLEPAAGSQGYMEALARFTES